MGIFMFNPVSILLNETTVNCHVTLIFSFILTLTDAIPKKPNPYPNHNLRNQNQPVLAQREAAIIDRNFYKRHVTHYVT